MEHNGNGVPKSEPVKEPDQSAPSISLGDSGGFLSVDIIWNDLEIPVAVALRANVKDLKTRLQEITGLPVQKQKLVNFPYQVLTMIDEILLASVDLSRPIKLEEKTKEEMRVKGGLEKGTHTLEHFISMLDTLSSDSVNDELQQQYGSNLPKFYRGKCSAALSEAKRKCVPLFIYLHHIANDNTAPICMEVLASPSVSSFLNEQFVPWAGKMDLTSEDTLKTFVGSTDFPFMTVVAYTPSGTNILDSFGGLISADVLFGRLIQIIETHGPALSKLRERMSETEMKQRLLEQQDEEFRQALERDKERARIQQLEEEKKQAELKRIEEEHRQILITKTATLEDKRKSIPKEPPLNDPQSTTIVLRMTDGSKQSRRFWRSDTIGDVLNYAETLRPLQVEDAPELELVSNFPRKVFVDTSVTLQQEGLFPQAMLFVSEKNA